MPAAPVQTPRAAVSPGVARRDWQGSERWANAFNGVAPGRIQTIRPVINPDKSRARGSRGGRLGVTTEALHSATTSSPRGHLSPRADQRG